ncbi:MAG: glutathione S-transferase family protein [Cyanobacteria bacterium]|nr:glutathione S-transferase family protein [Cyanobacteria bacterium CG_2015-16_32_12]NCO78322.1 glutathione S-transferase family protein [Cyanobacteria bacterium CG_2015-22_32_23]NCQ03784.1 glutathione S-transferase family protein [Cyanobacteria bacterium CG_2015-09_32_10]NCQ41073.1 glutathione S-transferase family protein [Cyanobacteria bacterium CG_2015-04_32_10]NCS83791.1 glutathione S-transferase family protein [Cyanobacteria bacterium CG_2015-02_32_10]
MLELYQFELSQFSEKVRLILDFKGLEYKKIEVTPGIGQLEVFKLSGQRQVPILKDGDTVIADSTEIALYLDQKYPEKPLIPADSLLRGQCLLMEGWADECLGLKGRKAFIGALNHYPNFRTSFLPKNTPDILKTFVSAFPSEIFNAIGVGLTFGTDILKTAEKGLKQDLDALTLILQNQPYLVGDTPTLADLTVAALTTIIKFPPVTYFDLPIDLEGKGIPGLADNSNYEFFFEWRDRLYTQYRQPVNKSNSNNFGGGSNDSQPTSIEIE